MPISEVAAALAVRDLEVRYGAALALADVSLEVAPGSVHALLGANGAGKSSFARACAGLVVPSGGSIALDGVEIARKTARDIRRAGVVYLPEGRGIFPNLTVQENLKVAVRLAPGREGKRKALDVAQRLFPILSERRTQPARNLSGGEQQMLALARALAVPPRIVIADELSLGLAPKIVDQVFAILADMKQDGTTMIIIEQFAHRALGLADGCTILRRGSVAWSGRADGVGDDLLLHYLGQ